MLSFLLFKLLKFKLLKISPNIILFRNSVLPYISTIYFVRWLQVNKNLKKNLSIFQLIRSYIYIYCSWKKYTLFYIFFEWNLTVSFQKMYASAFRAKKNIASTFFVFTNYFAYYVDECNCIFVSCLERFHWLDTVINY